MKALEGIKIIEQEYGKSLKWKRVPLFDIEKIYEEIN